MEKFGLCLFRRPGHVFACSPRTVACTEKSTRARRKILYSFSYYDRPKANAAEAVRSPVKGVVRAGVGIRLFLSSVANERTRTTRDSARSPAGAFAISRAFYTTRLWSGARVSPQDLIFRGLKYIIRRRGRKETTQRRGGVKGNDDDGDDDGILLYIDLVLFMLSFPSEVAVSRRPGGGGGGVYAHEIKKKEKTRRKSIEFGFLLPRGRSIYIIPNIYFVYYASPRLLRVLYEDGDGDEDEDAFTARSVASSVSSRHDSVQISAERKIAPCKQRDRQ